MEVEILIVDNDPVICYLSQELLQDAGYTTLILQDSRRVMQLVKELKPRAVILDIIMPGVDGLTLCRAIKADPETKDTKVIVASAKAFSVEKERALRFGAELFLQKPYAIDSFVSQIVGVVGQPSHPTKKEAGKPAFRPTLEVRVWGSRSNAPAASQAAVDARTPCVSVETKDHLFIFDAGLGVIPLGESLVREGARKEIWLFLTHFHPAHVEGLGRFAPSRSKDVRLHIGGPNDPDKTLDAAVRELFQQSFAADPRPISAKMQLYVFQEGEYDVLPGIRISTFYTNHPTTTLGYRLDFSGRSIVYCPDSEISGDTATSMQDYDEALGRKCRHADLLIHDGRYSADDYSRHKNEGHSSLLDALVFAAEQEVEQLLLFHLDGSYSETELENLGVKGREHLQQKALNLRFQIAKEGMKITI